MITLDILLEEVLNIELNDMILSGARSHCEAAKIKVRPLLLKGELKFQVTRFVGKQVFHENCDQDELALKLKAWISQDFNQTLIRTTSQEVTISSGKKGQVSIKRRNVVRSAPIAMDHNRIKNYILKEGQPIDFLVDLGVMTPNGDVVKARYDKFRQINRYLEFIEDVLKELDRERQLTIVDFGCGKSYLTFAVYYYLKVLKGYDVCIIGLDLKEDVISHCNAVAEKYGYENLTFLQGDIAAYEGLNQVDMVISLHACDTATDQAIYKAVKWNAKVILAVPCCQHELNAQIHSKELKAAFDYGVLKERIAALITDGLRAKLLEEAGYKTQILEFIETEHTPKNLLIRAVRERKVSRLELTQDYRACCELLHVSPMLEKLLLGSLTE